ncbi:MAG TPA: glycerophosphodiester phosphodiesterase [Planctomicrobium sp.]|nr:glycerophosphodiester phosphodiesterase [Planctomicrobium sp.]
MQIRGCGVAVLFLLGTLFCSIPVSAQESTIILAHRGGAFEFEENTMEGFRACYDQGIRGFETDIRMTKDGALVILHDDSLDRTHTGTGPVEEKTAAELKEIRTKKKGQTFLFLEEFLEYFNDKPGVYIELEMKTSNKKLYSDDRVQEYCRKLYQTVESLRPEGSTYVYSSFDERPIRAIHHLDAKAPVSYIAGKPCSTEFIEKAKALGADRIACRLDGTSRTAVLEAHQAGLKVNGWPGRSSQDYLLALGLGIDVHCTDIPLEILKWKKRLE